MYTDIGPDLRRASDAMLQHTFRGEGPRQDRLTELQRLGQHLGGLVLLDWPQSHEYEHEGLRAALVLACQPAMESLIGGSLSHETPEAVNRNLQYVSRFALEGRLFSQSRRRVFGELSEAAVLSLLWWGAENGYADENSYFLPSTTRQDSSKGGGLQNGVDIVGKLNDRKIAVQVKTSKKRASRPYAKGISVVSTEEITRSEDATKSLALAYANNSIGFLSACFERLELMISNTAERAKRSQFNPANYKKPVITHRTRR